MKKIYLFVAVALMLTASFVYAGNPESKSITLNAATFTAITIDHSTVGRDVGVITSDSTAWVFSDDAAGTVEIIVPAPGGLSMECRQDTNGVLFYAKASAGTPTLSVILGVCQP